jgi:hypothetical protein
MIAITYLFAYLINLFARSVYDKIRFKNRASVLRLHAVHLKKLSLVRVTDCNIQLSAHDICGMRDATIARNLFDKIVALSTEYD